MKLPRPLVILFGAGATRAALEGRSPPPPLDGDFFEIAAQIRGRGTPRLAKRVSKDVHDLHDKVVGIGLEQYYRDIETRLELSRFAKSANRPKDWNTRRKNLEELIRRVLIQTTCEMDRGSTRVEPSRIHRAILAKLKRGDALITYNYDTLIEESMPENDSLWTPRDGYGIPVSGITHEWSKKWFSIRKIPLRTKARIKLYKLHGSVNWRLNQINKIVIKKRPYVVKSRSGSPNFEEAAFLPPGWHKRIDRRPYNIIWRNARLELEKCKSVVIIGYSLPDTDLIARALFLEVARLRKARKNFVKELHIADTSESTRNRIIDLFIPALGPEGIVFRYGSAKELAERWK
ncbi:MAG TPA: SIR2 family protein [Xanthobacteraceae bacterium]|nr:SIR2 family protein [Xanthobacteraceae bacterium]